MPVVDVIRVIVAAGVAAAIPLASPSELLIDDIPGFELAGEPGTDLDFVEFALVEPDSVAHIDPESEEAAALVAALETWADAASNQTIVVEIVRAIDSDEAATFVDQAAATSIAKGLGAVDPPFGGAWSYSGGLDGTWTNVVAWTQGPYAAILTQRSPGETDRTVVDTAAVRQVEVILDVTGAEVSEAAAVDDEAPTPPTDAPDPDDAEADQTGTFPVGVILGGLLLLGVMIGLALQRRSSRSS